MKKIILLLSLIVPMLAACSKEQISSRPCDFDVEITELKGSKIRFTITPSNPEAYYTFALIAGDEPMYEISGEPLIARQMTILKEFYDLFGRFGRKNASFADSFCYKGRTEQAELFLSRDMPYKLAVFQVNPWKMEGMGTPEEVFFRTLNPKIIDLDFDLQFSGDTLRIHPSDPERTYVWDYESKEIVDDEYGSPLIYYYTLMDMYEQYGFMESVLCEGDFEWVFPRDDEGMPAGKDWYLILSGYKDGEVDSEETLVLFNWEPEQSCIKEWFLPIKDLE